MRSSLILSAAPSAGSNASKREYAKLAHVDRETVTRHTTQRDAEQAPGGGELYKLIRKIKVDLDRLYYEVRARYAHCLINTLAG